MRGFLSVTRFHNDVPIEVAIVRIFGECPNTGHNHAKAARLKQIPVAHACHLLFGRHNIGFLLHINHVLQRFNVFRGIHRELREVIIEEAATVLLNGLIELVEGNRMVIAVDIITQRTDFLRRSHCVLPLPVVRGVIDASLIKQILVVNQHNIREAVRHTILHTVSAECFQGHIVVDRGVDAVFGQDVIQRHQCALLCVGDEILVIQFKNIGSLAAGNLRRHLRKVIVIAIGLQVDGDIGVFFHIVVNHLLQILLIVAGARVLCKCDCHRLIGSLRCCRAFRRSCIRRTCHGTCGRGRRTAGAECKHCGHRACHVRNRLFHCFSSLYK